MNAFPMYAVEFKDCAIPASQRLGGDAGCDFPLLLNSSRTALSAMALDVARAPYEICVDYTKNRKAFGDGDRARQQSAFTLPK